MEEPKRKSFLDTLKRNLVLADRIGITTRFVYIGEHKASKDDLQNLQKQIKEKIKKMNEEYNEIVITGLLILYPRYFLHLIEASEVMIYRHLQAIFLGSFEKMFGRVILLPEYHNIYKMYYTNWYSTIETSPPVLLDKVEGIGLEEITKQIKNCLFKMYSLSEYLMDVGTESPEKIKEDLKHLSKVVPHYLPEVTIIEYLLTTEHVVLQDIRDYLENYIEIPYINFYNDRIWPPVSSFVPHLHRKEEDLS